MPRKSKQQTQYEDIQAKLNEISEMLARREHIDTDFQVLKKELEGNGKPGYKQIRDKVIGWETKINSIIVLIFGDIVVRVIQYALR